MTTFTSIRLRNWRQFASVSIDFHPRLTIITGSNGAGKSTILNICSQHFGYARPFLATPKRRKGGGIAYDLGYYSPHGQPEATSDIFDEDFEDDLDQDDEDQLDFLVPPISEESEQKHPAHMMGQNAMVGQFVDIGSISYQNGVVATIGFHENQSQAYGLQINN